MADYKEKLVEVKGTVKDVAANIASEENKQKVANAAGSVAQKAKGMSKKQKLIALCAVVAVVVIALIAKGGGAKPKKELESYLTQRGYTLMDNMKVIYDTKTKVRSIASDGMFDGNYEKVHLYVITCETEKGNNLNSHRYSLYRVVIYDKGNVMITGGSECSDKKEFEAWVDMELSSIKQDSKDGVLW